MTPTNELLPRCDRCGKRLRGTMRHSISIINTEPDDIAEGRHYDDQELLLCIGCVELCRIEINNAVRRIREGCDA